MNIELTDDLPKSIKISRALVVIGVGIFTTIVGGSWVAATFEFRMRAEEESTKEMKASLVRIENRTFLIQQVSGVPRNQIQPLPEEK